MCVDDFSVILLLQIGVNGKVSSEPRFYRGAKPGILKPRFSVTLQEWNFMHFLYDVQVAV